jgi:hypothetical protein
MKLRIDQFYRDDNYGVMKFVGYSPDEKLMFERYEKSQFTKGAYSGWLPMGQRVNLDPEFQQRRFKLGRTKPILPPA